MSRPILLLASRLDIKTDTSASQLVSIWARASVPRHACNIACICIFAGKCNHTHTSVRKPAAVDTQVSNAFYAALGDSILRSLRLSPTPCTLSPLHQAQISLGLQPRKFSTCLVPEFKHRLVVVLDKQPPLVNGKLAHDLCLPHVIIPLVGPENGGMDHGPPSACYPSQPCSSAPHTNCIAVRLGHFTFSFIIPP